MKALTHTTLGHTLALALIFTACPALAQDDDMSEVVVTASRRPGSIGTVVPKRPVIGLKRQADSAVRHIEIISDSRESDLRKREVQAMLLAALDRAKAEGLTLVTGQFEVTEVTRDNWRDKFPQLAGKADADDSEDDESSDDEDSDNGTVQPGFTDDGSTATLRLMVKVKLDGSIANAQQKITAFVKKVPATGRSVIEQKGGLALTIVKPDQYRDEIFQRVAAGAKHAVSFYGPEYGVTVTGLDGDVAWDQVSNTEVFLYIAYGFTVGK